MDNQLQPHDQFIAWTAWYLETVSRRLVVSGDDLKFAEFQGRIAYLPTLLDALSKEALQNGIDADPIINAKLSWGTLQTALPTNSQEVDRIMDPVIVIAHKLRAMQQVETPAKRHFRLLETISGILSRLGLFRPHMQPHKSEKTPKRYVACLEHPNDEYQEGSKSP